jgi:hypothetical protein
MHWGGEELRSANSTNVEIMGERRCGKGKENKKIKEDERSKKMWEGDKDKKNLKQSKAMPVTGRGGP